MPNIQPSPPFNFAPHDYYEMAKEAGLFFMAAFGTFGTTILLPWLTSHENNQGGVLIVALLAAGFAWLANQLKRFVTDTTKVVKLLILAVGLALCSCGVASAGDTAILVPSLSPGSYLLSVDSNGGVALSPLDRVVRVNPNPTPIPIPPTPGPLTDRAIQIRDAASKATGDSARAETAQGLARLFRSIAQLTPQAASPAALEAALKVALDQFMSSRGTSAATAWEPVRSLISTGITLLEFNKAPLSDYAVFFGEVASGLDASAPGEKEISPQMLQLIEMILQIVLAMFKIPVPPLPTP